MHTDGHGFFDGMMGLRMNLYLEPRAPAGGSPPTSEQHKIWRPAEGAAGVPSSAVARPVAVDEASAAARGTRPSSAVLLRTGALPKMIVRQSCGHFIALAGKVTGSGYPKFLTISQ